MSTAILVLAGQLVLAVLVIVVLRFARPPKPPKLSERRVSRALPQKKSRRGGR